MADVIGKINCYGIVIDYTRNAYNVETFRNSHERFYKWVRAYHPNTRIVLMTSSNFNHWRDYFEFDQIVRTTYEKALERNENVKLLEVMKLFDESEYSLVAVDGSHINDVGMFRVARALTELLQG